jgi:hypothetical protein
MSCGCLVVVLLIYLSGRGREFYISSSETKKDLNIQPYSFLYVKKDQKKKKQISFFPAYMYHQDKISQDKTTHDKTRQDNTVQHKTRQSKTTQGKARQGRTTRQDKTSQAKKRQDKNKTRKDKAR